MSSVNEMIIQALDGLEIPISAETSSNVSMPYITFNYSDDRGTAFSDNEPELDDISMQIHLFTNASYDYLSLKKQIRSALFEAGFSYPQITVSNEDDYNHIIFECEIALEREEEE